VCPRASAAAGTAPRREIVRGARSHRARAVGDRRVRRAHGHAHRHRRVRLVCTRRAAGTCRRNSEARRLASTISRQPRGQRDSRLAELPLPRGRDRHYAIAREVVGHGDGTLRAARRVGLHRGCERRERVEVRCGSRSATVSRSRRRGCRRGRLSPSSSSATFFDLSPRFGELRLGRGVGLGHRLCAWPTARNTPGVARPARPWWRAARERGRVRLRELHVLALVRVARIGAALPRITTRSVRELVAPRREVSPRRRRSPRPPSPRRAAPPRRVTATRERGLSPGPTFAAAGATVTFSVRRLLAALADRSAHRVRGALRQASDPAGRESSVRDAAPTRSTCTYRFGTIASVIGTLHDRGRPGERDALRSFTMPLRRHVTRPSAG